MDKPRTDASRTCTTPGCGKPTRAKTKTTCHACYKRAQRERTRRPLVLRRTIGAPDPRREAHVVPAAVDDLDSMDVSQLKGLAHSLGLSFEPKARASTVRDAVRYFRVHGRPPPPPEPASSATIAQAPELQPEPPLAPVDASLSTDCLYLPKNYGPLLSALQVETERVDGGYVVSHEHALEGAARWTVMSTVPVENATQELRAAYEAAWPDKHEAREEFWDEPERAERAFTRIEARERVLRELVPAFIYALARWEAFCARPVDAFDQQVLRSCYAEGRPHNQLADIFPGYSEAAREREDGCFYQSTASGMRLFFAPRPQGAVAWRVYGGPQGALASGTAPSRWTAVLAAWDAHAAVLRAECERAGRTWSSVADESRRQARSFAKPELGHDE